MGWNFVSNFLLARSEMLNSCHLRLASRDAPQISPARLPQEKPPTSQTPLRVVIIEDELMVAWVLEGTLETLGHEIIDIHPTGESAISAGIGEATLLIADINLGDGIDGIVAATELRRSSPVPIIFCSAYSDQTTRQRATAAVPNAVFVTKPFVTRDIKEAIEAATSVQH